MEEFISSFINEAQELLVQLEKDLLYLEKEPNDSEVINKIFRVMHTLKGSAGMYGFMNISHLSHEFENIYAKLREKEMKVTAELIDATLKGKDLLLNMLDKKPSEEKSQALIALLRDNFIQGSLQEKTSFSNISDMNRSKQNNYCVLFLPDKTIFERGLDPDIALNELGNSGFVKIIPHEKRSSWTTQKSKKVCNTIWEVYLRTALTGNEIEEIFLFYDDTEFRIIDLSDDSYKTNSVFQKFLKKHYKNVQSANDHTEACIKELIASDDDTDQHEKIPVADEKVTEIKSTDVSNSDIDSTINVSSRKLDELLNLVSELVTSTAGLEAFEEKYKDVKLNNIIEDIEKLTKRFRNNALDLRLVPVGTLLEKFKRHVRDLSKELNKCVNLIVEGNETEIDKAILKSIESPLLHIIRNSIDHGIEHAEERIKKGKANAGLLKIVAFYSGANVVIQVQDDGSGINLDRVKECAIKNKYILPDQVVTQQELLNLIMEPGFTTSENISMVSGRGVGMDVVRKQLNAVSGSLEIDTEKDLGTCITMKLPTTLSIIDTLMIEVSNSKILIPLLEIEYCYKENRELLFDSNNKYIRYKNEMVPYVSLREKFKYQEKKNDEEMVIIINKFEKKYALIVDQIIGEHQAVIKPLGELFINQPYFSGGSIMVDGKLALILDTNYLFNQLIIN
ncbi:MAG: chemotaxis protein CheA [Bacteroidales bacterium]|nr:chemotaxis protein CheA [Bacteroidales bacterium]